MGDLLRSGLVVSGERVELPGEPVTHALGGKRDVAPEEDTVGPRERAYRGQRRGAGRERGIEVEALQIG